MLDKNDLQAIAELMRQQKEELSEIMDTKIGAAIAASEDRMSAKIDNAIAASEEHMSAKIDNAIAASEDRMKAYINEKVTDETNRAIAYTENVVETKLDAIKEGLDLALETRIPVDRIERIEENVTVLMGVVSKHSEEIAMLKKAQ